VFAHLPLILGPSGDKLSKRDGATAVPEYQHMGFLPEALFNYLVRLGWAHGDQEVFTRQELIQYFSLDAVGKKGAIFDIQKLTWLNGVYIRHTSEQELLERITHEVMPDLRDKLKKWPEPVLVRALVLYKERAKTLQELAHELILLHDGPVEFVAADVAQWTTPQTREHLAHIAQALEKIADFTLEPIQNGLKALAKQLEVKLVALAQPIRIALVGKSMSPGVFELLALLGKTESLRRVRAFLDFLKKRG
jgi:glutamyl-tRNA synthetase